MARALRIEYSGAIYHVTCRLVGSWKEGDRDLFRDNADRQRFLDSLATRVEAFSVVLHQYVLMRNHFHLVVETPRGNCSAFMQSLLTSYTVYFNLRHQRHGHLFDGRYKAKLVEGDAYLLNLSRYVHLNPVRISSTKDSPMEMLKRLHGYRWSSYLQYINQSKRVEFVTYEPTLAVMEGEVRGRPRRYRQFVESGVGNVDDDFSQVMSLSRLGIGSETFRDELLGRYSKLVASSGRPEDAAFRKIAKTLPADAVLRELIRLMACTREDFVTRSKGTAYRPFAARYLTRFAGLSQREVADILCVGSGVAVNLQLRRFKELVENNRELQRLACKCEEAFKKMM